MSNASDQPSGGAEAGFELGAGFVGQRLDQSSRWSLYEAKELVGGCAVLEVRSKAEAIELAKRLMQIHKDHWPGWEGSCEVRQLSES